MKKVFSLLLIAFLAILVAVGIGQQVRAHGLGKPDIVQSFPDGKRVELFRLGKKHPLTIVALIDQNNSVLAIRVIFHQPVTLMFAKLLGQALIKEVVGSDIMIVMETTPPMKDSPPAVIGLYIAPRDMLRKEGLIP